MSGLLPSLFTKEQPWAIRSGRSRLKRSTGAICAFSRANCSLAHKKQANRSKTNREFPTPILPDFTYVLWLNNISSLKVCRASSTEQWKCIHKEKYDRCGYPVCTVVSPNLAPKRALYWLRFDASKRPCVQAKRQNPLRHNCIEDMEEMERENPRRS